MRIAVLSPGGANVAPLYAPLGDRVVAVVSYDDPSQVVERVVATMPDAVLYVGACPDLYDPRKVPTPEQLAAVNNLARTIHLCCDGAEPAWWPWIERYRDCFARQVNIDGVTAGPWKYDDVALFPVDPSLFRPLPWAERPTVAGFAGGLYNDARRALAAATRGFLTVRPREEGPYEAYADFVRGCRIVVNEPLNGREALQVKARIVEAGAAGCLVLERRGSPARAWFEPGVHYLEYDGYDHLRALLSDERLAAGAEAVGKRLREEVVTHHTALDLYGRLGLL